MQLYKNLFFMLAYAFTSLKFDEKKYASVDDFNAPEDILTEILYLHLSSAIKKGFYKEYIDKNEVLRGVKGKINISESIRPANYIYQKINCEFDEFSVNNYINQIIKCAMNLLLKSNAQKQRKDKLRKLTFYFNNVDLIKPKDIKRNIRYSNLNNHYKFIILVCWLTLHNNIYSEDKEKVKMFSFLDKDKMSTIYERFIYKYYEKEHLDKINIRNKKIERDLQDGDTTMLPEMKGDIILSSKTNNNLLIIDAKYYANNLQEHFNKGTVKNAHLYQIYAYANNMKHNETDKDVYGILLYAKTDADIQPETYDLKLQDVTLRATTLDLTVPIEQVRNQLDNIIKQYLV